MRGQLFPIIFMLIVIMIVGIMIFYFISTGAQNYFVVNPAPKFAEFLPPK